MAIICKSCYSSKSRPAFHILLLQKRALEKCLAFYKIKFAMNCTCHWRLRSIHFPQFYDSKNILKDMNMKQDRRLNNGLLMRVKNFIMNDPDTVMVTSKQTAFCPTHYANDILGNLSREIRLTFCTMSPPPPPPAPYVCKRLRCL